MGYSPYQTHPTPLSKEKRARSRIPYWLKGDPLAHALIPHNVEHLRPACRACQHYTPYPLQTVRHISRLLDESQCNLGITLQRTRTHNTPSTMNKGHIQAERAEAIAKALNTGTQQNVENVNRERTVAEFHVNTLTGIATAWKHDEHGTRAHVYQQGGAHRWHVTHNGVDGMPTIEGSEASAAKALESAALAMGCNGYKLS